MSIFTISVISIINNYNDDNTSWTIVLLSLHADIARPLHAYRMHARILNDQCATAEPI